MVLLPRVCSFHCCFCESALPSSAEAPTWGGGRRQEPAQLCLAPEGRVGRLEAPTPSPAWSLLAGITALWCSSCCPPAGPLASGPGCQPTGRGGSLAVSQLTVPELSAGRQARQGRDPRPPPRMGPWPGHWDRAEPLTATAIRGPYGCRPQTGLRDIISLGGDSGGLVPIYSAQLSL